MTRRTLGTLLAATVLLTGPLAACGDDDASSSDTTTDERRNETTTTASDEPALDPQDAVLTLEDLPAGYAERQDEDDDGDTPTKSCPRLEALDRDDEEPLDKASSSFQAAEDGPFIDHQVSVLAEGEAERALEQFSGALDDPACRTFTTTSDDGKTATYTLTEISVPRLGDDTVGLRLTGDATALSVTLDLVLERIGDTGSFIAVTTVPGLSGPPPDLGALAQRADEKLRAA